MASSDTIVSRVDMELFNDACDLGPFPLSMSKILRRFLTNLFSDPDNLENKSQAIQKMVWQDNPATGIAIVEASAWVPELTEKRPGVIIRRGGWKQVRAGIDNRMMPAAPNGKNYYCNFWQGSHTMMCITGAGPETDMLLAEVFRALNQFGPRLRQKLGLMKLEVMEGGEQAILEGEARENFVAPVSLAYAYQEMWRLEDLSSPVMNGLQVGVVSPT